MARGWTISCDFVDYDYECEIWPQYFSEILGKDIPWKSSFYSLWAAKRTRSVPLLENFAGARSHTLPIESGEKSLFYNGRNNVLVGKKDVQGGFKRKIARYSEKEDWVWTEKKTETHTIKAKMWLCFHDVLVQATHKIYCSFLNYRSICYYGGKKKVSYCEVSITNYVFVSA